METELTKRIKALTHHYRPKLHPSFPSCYKRNSAVPKVREAKAVQPAFSPDLSFLVDFTAHICYNEIINISIVNWK